MDPLKLDWWPMGWALVWIPIRDLDAASELLKPTSDIRHVLALDQDQTDKAFQELIDVLRKGFVRARGSRFSGYPLVVSSEQDIAPGEWLVWYEAVYGSSGIQVHFPEGNYEYKAIRVNVQDVMAVWPTNTPRRLASTSKRLPPKQDLVLEADAALWPDAPPARGSGRDRMIQDWIKNKYGPHAVPNERTIRAALNKTKA
jgi:hypothetical protein